MCISNESCLAMGGGGGGFAFQIDDELDAGETNPSETFGSPRLSSGEFFRCDRGLVAECSSVLFTFLVAVSH